MHQRWNRIGQQKVDWIENPKSRLDWPRCGGGTSPPTSPLSLKNRLDYGDFQPIFWLKSSKNKRKPAKKNIDMSKNAYSAIKQCFFTVIYRNF